MNEKQVFIENFGRTSRLGRNLQKSLQKTSHLFPLNEAKLGDISEDEAEQIELLIGRFSKLQDILGSKIFRSIIALDFEDASSMRDVLNKMEKKHIVVDADDWGLIRQARNNVIHEYVPEGKIAAEKLNEVAQYAPDLLQIIVKIKEYAINNLQIEIKEFK